MDWEREGGFQFKKHYFGPKSGELRETTASGAQLLTLGVFPDAARREYYAMLQLTITVTTPYPNRLSLQANLKDYAWLVELMREERGKPLAEINTRLADHIVGINNKL